jgi:hypothetical protein
MNESTIPPQTRGLHTTGALIHHLAKTLTVLPTLTFHYEFARIRFLLVQKPDIMLHSKPTKYLINLIDVQVEKHCKLIIITKKMKTLDF